jgi:aconitate hydratase 2/2-methylisocitrate dehydratase
MGKDARVYLGSAELSAACALLGRIPTIAEYREIVSQKIDPFAGDLYRYLNFDQIAGFADAGRVIALEDMPRIEDVLGIPAGALRS